VEVLVFNEQSDLSIARDSVEPLVKNVLKLEKRKTNEVSIHFVSTDVISSLHEEYFNDPSTTDCISFPMDEDEDLESQEVSSYHILGEVFICPKTALDYTKDHPY
jgi:probable rRNA maturation factor